MTSLAESCLVRIFSASVTASMRQISFDGAAEAGVLVAARAPPITAAAPVATTKSRRDTPLPCGISRSPRFPPCCFQFRWPQTPYHEAVARAQSPRPMGTKPLAPTLDRTVPMLASPEGSCSHVPAAPAHDHVLFFQDVVFELRNRTATCLRRGGGGAIKQVDNTATKRVKNLCRCVTRSTPPTRPSPPSDRACRTLQ